MRVTAGAPDTGHNFYQGRQVSVSELRNKIKNNDVLLIGPRRTGKTSVALEFLEQEKESVQNIYEFYIVVAHEILDKCKKYQIIQGKFTTLIQKISNLFSEILPEGIDFKRKFIARWRSLYKVSPTLCLVSILHQKVTIAFSWSLF